MNALQRLLKSMTTATPEEMLKDLETLKETLLDATNYQREQIAKFEQEIEEALPDIQTAIADLEQKLKAAVVERGETLKGEWLQVVYNGGGDRIPQKNVERLKGYALAKGDKTILDLITHQKPTAYLKPLNTKK